MGSLKTKLRKGLNLIWINLGVTLLLLVGLELFSYFFVEILFPPKPNLKPAYADAYMGAEWAVAYYPEDEFNTFGQWSTYNYWKHNSKSGKYININNEGIRETPYPKEDSSSKIKVYFYGGSAMWGYGVPDNMTIPSVVGQEMLDKGVAADITNLAQLGWTNTQSLLELIKQLQLGDVPDYVVFYDGFNEIYTALMSGEVGQTIAEVKMMRATRLMEGSSEELKWINGIRGIILESYTMEMITKISKKLGLNKPQIGDDFEKEGSLIDASKVISLYLANIKIIKALGFEYGFEPLFFWQPSVFQKENKSPHEQLYAEAYSPYAIEKYAEIVDEMKSATDSGVDNFWNLSDLFLSTPEPIFLDQVHISHIGNRIVAHEIAQKLMMLFAQNASSIATKEEIK